MWVAALKDQMNEADRALIGVGDVHVPREYADMQKAKSEWRCKSERQKATHTRRLSVHPADGTVEVHRR